MKSSVSSIFLSFLLMLLAKLARAMARKPLAIVVSVISFFVFITLDFHESLFCIIYSFLDQWFDGEKSVCYCRKRGNNKESSDLSESLYGRKNVFRVFIRLFGFLRKFGCYKKSSSGVGKINRRWFECGCESCVRDSEGENLHVVMKESSKDSPENVIFLHGLLSSSSLWKETVFPNLSEAAQNKYRLFCVDLLGFGKSPKPSDCYYTLKDHIEMIEKSVIKSIELESFHLVAHSMGSILALAIAAKYPNLVKSITLIAPPYVPNCNSGMAALKKLAKKKVWPPASFLSAILAWYEHLMRCQSLIICKNHRLWKRILKLITGKKETPFFIVDMIRHTHHSMWHTTHNLIFGGAKLVDGFLEKLMESKVKIYVMHGEKDDVVPLQCSSDLKAKVPSAELSVISNADHGSVMVGREKKFTRDLERNWASSTAANANATVAAGDIENYFMI